MKDRRPGPLSYADRSTEAQGAPSERSAWIGLLIVLAVCLVAAFLWINWRG